MVAGIVSYVAFQQQSAACIRGSLCALERDCRQGRISAVEQFSGVYSKEPNLVNGRNAYKHVSRYGEYTIMYNEQQLSWEVNVIFS